MTNVFTENNITSMTRDVPIIKNSNKPQYSMQAINLFLLKGGYEGREDLYTPNMKPVLLFDLM